jgi:hypothetical protein
MWCLYRKSIRGSSGSLDLQAALRASDRNTASARCNAIIKHAVMLLAVAFLFACSERPESEWGLKETERKTRVHEIVEKHAKESFEGKAALYTELRDTLVRKRDIPWLTEEIAETNNAELKLLLQDLIKYMDGCWRLPVRGWTGFYEDCGVAYSERFDRLGYMTLIYDQTMYPHLSSNRPIIGLSITDSSPITDGMNSDNIIDPEEEHRIAAAIELIHILEPESIQFVAVNFKEVKFLSILENLETITIISTPVIDLKPLEELANLRSLALIESGLKDLSTLKKLSHLQRLHIQDVGTNDLKPLEALSELKQLSIVNMPVVDLSPLRVMTQLSELNLWDVPVTDLTSLAELKNLRELSLNNTKVTDLTLLKDLPNLERIYLDDSEGIDLTSLAGSSVVVLPVKLKRLPQW